MSLLGDDESLNPSHAGSSLLTDDDYEQFSQRYRGIEYLSNVDYSLNSPLIRDELEEFNNYLKGKSHRKSWNMSIWKARKTALVQSHSPVNIFKSTSDFHQWFGNKNLSTRFNGSRISEILTISQSDSQQTFPILQTFLYEWINKTVENPDKSACPSEVKKWGAYFLDLHMATLILNASDDKEISELCKIKGIRRHSKDNPRAVVFRSLNFGKILIVAGFCFFIDEKLMMDRNLLLMCKDTYVARFQTLLSMINRLDDEFELNDWKILSQVYQAGDKILARSGNDGYNALKLVEPISTVKISEFAGQHRPLIPAFSNFKDHILASVDDLALTIPGVVNLRNEIFDLPSVELALTVFGSFRHWGHPFINYLEGLKKVESQVNMHKDIDEEYASALASDLAYIVLQSKFRETKQWYVDSEQISEDHPLRSHILNNTWPTPKQVIDFGDHWNLLPLKKCFDVPDMLDPSIIYADKSHSMDREDVLNHVRRDPNSPIPTKKVLETLLKRKDTNWKDFLDQVDRSGLSINSLVIGLKAKEREIKSDGRFFSLMTWELREYFVVTEYLIKTHFVPLFKGLTMADDLNTVIKKLMDNSSGQGNEDYENICIANHIDYTKWNNHQRDEANKPVFKVMDQFLGFSSLISRTHQFFQESLIYYNGRPDLMRVVDDELINRDGSTVCWQGQQGGLEGLRQKGWSVVNLLVIRRESFNRNTKVTLLAQGDNQVICSKFKLQKTRNNLEVIQAIAGIVRENQNIMDSIEGGTTKLGLVINKDETLQSADYLVYGKVPIYRGSIRGLESKRWARVTCVTNDQLPTLANTMSSISSNALTVAHFATSPVNAMVHYNFLGNFSRNLLDIHNPAIKSRLESKVKYPDLLNTAQYKSLVLYLDPCLGGACGMSLTRFFIRGFPDPVTESLVFWKAVYNSSKPWVKQLALRAGNPLIASLNTESFKKLIEDPSGLNIHGSSNPTTMIKEEIKRALINNSEKVKNELMRSALVYMRSQEALMYDFLRSIKPLFPRFISEYLSATYLGIVQSLIGLFQNSKTIRTVFTRRIDGKIKSLIVKSEIQTIDMILGVQMRRTSGTLWRCSSTHADKLRRESWGEKVYGATVPHPMEVLGPPQQQGVSCPHCMSPPPRSYYISTLVPRGLYQYKIVRGPYKAYLGSKTSETTSIIQQWERETKIPLLKRATKLRSAIGWFIEPGSRLGNSILQNLEALTGDLWDTKLEGAKRTGSALHRFSCSRQSTAGYSAQSPAKLTWMCTTSDTLSTLNSINHDFMHQSLLIYAQATVSEIMDNDYKQGFFHHHINCEECLRPIDEVTLDTPRDFQHTDVSKTLLSWRPEGVPWFQEKAVRNIPEGNWNRVKSPEQSFSIGRACGFLYGDLKMSGDSRYDDSDIFPLSLQKKVLPRHFMEGILEGLIRASSVHCVSRRSIAELKRPREALLGVGLHLVSEVSRQPGLLTIWRSEGFENLFLEIAYKVPPSYPISDWDMGSLGRSFLRHLYLTRYTRSGTFKFRYRDIWIFADINDVKIFGMLSVSQRLVPILYRDKYHKGAKDIIRRCRDIIVQLRDPNVTLDSRILDIRNMRRTNEEIRHASKSITLEKQGSSRDSYRWGKELMVDAHAFPIPYVSRSMNKQAKIDKPSIPHYQNPLISGMRLFQFATGSHFKIQSILKKMGIQYQDAICGGDGSGGISSYILRAQPQSRIIFNSLLELEGVDLRGTAPSPPSAISALGAQSMRCVNLKTVWEHPSDLSDCRTWEYFLQLKSLYGLNIDLIILDMECQTATVSNEIENQLAEYAFQLLESHGVLIYKTFLSRIVDPSNHFLTKVGSQFRIVNCLFTDISSSQTSEVYLVCESREDSSIDSVPDTRMILGELSEFPVMQDLKTEFDRALRLKHYDMFKGVPLELLTDPIDDFAECITTLGVEIGLSAMLAETIREFKEDGRFELPYIAIFVTINSILQLTLTHRTSPRPPSDGQVYNLGAFVVAVLNWIALSSEDFIVHENAQRLIAKQFTLSWAPLMVTNRRTGQVSYLLKYSMTQLLRGFKSFHLDANLAKIGQIQRCFIRVFGYEIGEPDLGKLSKALKIFSDGLSVRSFDRLIDFKKLCMRTSMQDPYRIDPVYLPESDVKRCWNS